VYGDETWKTGRVDHKFLEDFEMCYWRKMVKIGWADRLRNYFIESRKRMNSQHIIKRRKSIWIGHISLRNCLLKHFITEIIEGSIEVTES
jgi:hypothetical protein